MITMKKNNQNNNGKKFNWKLALGIGGGVAAVGGGVLLYSKLKKNPVTGAAADAVVHTVVEHAGDVAKVVEF